MKNMFGTFLCHLSHNFITAINDNPLAINNNKTDNTFMKTKQKENAYNPSKY